jgi:hypothetical protein
MYRNTFNYTISLFKGAWKDVFVVGYIVRFVYCRDKILATSNFRKFLKIRSDLFR